VRVCVYVMCERVCMCENYVICWYMSTKACMLYNEGWCYVNTCMVLINII
jgi:hypothetical protein